VILVNSRETPPDNLDQAVSRKLGVPPKWTAYVEAENTLPWSGAYVSGYIGATIYPS
jgi:hypothetical protein